MMLELTIILNILRKKRISSKHITRRRKEHACDIERDKLKHFFIENLKEEKDLRFLKSVFDIQM